MTKKVILVVVEGETEQIILFDFLDEYFAQSEVRFDVQRGDMLSSWGKANANIKNTVGQVINKYLEKNKFLPQDLLAVVHITDADGCFIPHEYVKVSDDLTDALIYAEDGILVATTTKKQHIEDRNTLKAKNIKILSPIEFFTLRKRRIPYQLFYFSTNLEHVLWDERNERRDEKVDKADDFIETLECSIEDYLKKYLYIDGQTTYEEKMKSSWAHVMEDLNSLQRSTNVPLLMDMIEQVQQGGSNLQ
ncbi:MAG: hypothetical protein RR595_07360 [Lysinibacillus sp.]